VKKKFVAPRTDRISLSVVIYLPWIAVLSEALLPRKSIADCVFRPVYPKLTWSIMERVPPIYGRRRRRDDGE